MKEIFEMADVKKLTDDYCYLHANPETGFELDNTMAYVASKLSEMGIEYSKCGRCGISAVIGSKELSHTLLLRADMDALPIPGGAVHACGHDMHTAMLLGAARAIKANEEKLRCRVKLMFQSAEEILSGAKDMIDNGILKNPDVDYAFMIHVATACEYPSGTVIFASQGEIAPSADYFEINITGAPVHGATPHKGKDPITAGAHILCALQSINAREIAVDDSAVITVGTLRAGEAPNAIADKMQIKGTLRTYSSSSRDFVKGRVKEISQLVASALRTQADVVYTHGCPPFKNDGELLQTVSTIAGKLLGEDGVVMLERGARGGGSEDFAYVSEIVPSVMAVLCAGEKSAGYTKPLHAPDVKFDEKALPYGSALMAYIALNIS